jgi:hypothetical protein
VWFFLNQPRHLYICTELYAFVSLPEMNGNDFKFADFSQESPVPQTNELRNSKARKYKLTDATRLGYYYNFEPLFCLNPACRDNIPLRLAKLAKYSCHYSFILRGFTFDLNFFLEVFLHMIKYNTVPFFLTRERIHIVSKTFAPLIFLCLAKYIRISLICLGS